MSKEISDLQNKYYKKSKGIRDVLIREKMSFEKQKELKRENDEYFKKYMFFKKLNKASKRKNN